MKIITLLLLIPFFAWSQATVHFNQKENMSFTDPYFGRHRQGENFEDMILEEIQQAKRELLVAVQELSLPHLAQAFADAKNRGVDVKIVIENTYHNAFSEFTPEMVLKLTPHMQEKFAEFKLLADFLGNKDGESSTEEMQKIDTIRILRQNKIELKDDTADGSKGSGLMHHKFIIRDGESLVVTSANFSLSDFFGDLSLTSSRGNSNALLLIQSQGMVQIFREEFLQMWGQDNQKPRFGVKKNFRPLRRVIINGQKLSAIFSPFSSKIQWEQTSNGIIARELNAAQKSVDFALFVFSEQALANAMNGKSLMIRGLVEPSFAYREYSEMLDLLGVEILDPKCRYEEGNLPWIPPIVTVGIPLSAEGDKLHHKFAVIDGKKVIFGSHNWSEAANKNNDETLLVIEDSKIAYEFTKEVNRLSQKALLGVPNWLKKRIMERETACRKPNSKY